MSETETIIKAEGLTKIFRDFWKRPKIRAVDGLSFEVKKGEVLGLLGPNGSGKSTTIKMILGLLHPSAGKLSVLGASPDNPAVRLHVGYLPELSHLYQYLTPRETLSFFGGLFGIPSGVKRERTEQLLEMCGITDAADRAVGEFSKGMARRVGLAQCLINDPDLVILDEPTSGLDPIGRHNVKEIIRKLSENGKTVLLSSHLLGEIEDVCDRVAVLFRGKLISEGSLDSILSRNEQIRITVPVLDETALAGICAEIQTKTGKSPVIDHPAMTLEQFFLQAVEKAEGSSKLEPKIAGFLGGKTSGENVR